MNNQQLQTSVARFFPDDYTPDTWKDLLPRFIARHIELNAEQVRIYRLTLPADPTPEQMQPPAYPMLPEEFAESCEVMAQARGMNYRALAVCLYMDDDRRDYLQQQNDRLITMCSRYQELGEEMGREINALKFSMTPRNWLN